MTSSATSHIQATQATYPLIEVNRFRPSVQWPTWILILTIYSSWLALVLNFQHLPLWLSTFLLILVGAWYMSLQHELLHGHPSKITWLNQLLGILPIAVWYPYVIYRDNHIQHHNDEDLTHPELDTESNYLPPNQFHQLNKLHQLFRLALRTTLGRLLLGPAWAIFHLIKSSAQQLFKGNFKYLSTWLIHLSLLVVLLAALQKYASIPAWYYAGVIAYFTLGLAMLRSFYEHRPAALPQDRIVINEAGLFWRLLYLNNNYHSVHHAYPKLPWYAIAKVYWAQPDQWKNANHGFFVNGYCLFLLQHLIKPVDHPEHPGWGL